MTDSKPDTTKAEPGAPRVATVADRRSDQEREYGTYVAIEPIDLNGTRAFNIGDPVPVSHVDRGVVDETSVAKTTTKAGEAARRSAGGLDENAE